MRTAIRGATAAAVMLAAHEQIIPGPHGLEVVDSRIMPASPADIARFGRKDADPSMADVVRQLKETKTALATAEGQIKTWIEKAHEEIRNTGATGTETKNALAKMSEEAGAIASRLQAIEQKLAANDNPDAGRYVSLGEQVSKNDRLQQMLKDRGGKVRVGLKAITSITSGAGAAGDLITPTRLPGIISQPDRPMTIRAMLSQGRTNSNAIEYVQETGFTNAAAMVAEGAQKPESTIAFELMNAPVRTMAHWIQASKQVLDDVPQLESYINSRLRYGLELVEEDQILAGDGQGQNLLGLIPQATAFDAAYSQPGDTRIDTVRRAINQVRKAEYRADGIVMHPDDWTEIELTKTTEGAYIWASPRGLLQPTLWGLPVVETTAVDPGEFLVGAFRLSATIWDREDANVEVSTEDRDNFIKNMVTIRAEERLALTVFRPEALIYGDFDTIVSS